MMNKYTVREKIILLKKNEILVRFYKVFSVDVLVRASSIVLLPIYLRLMSQEEYGLFGYLIAIIGTFSSVLNFGLYTAQSKLFHEYKGKKIGEMLFNLNIILLILMSLTIGLVYLFKLDYKIIDKLIKNSLDYSSYRPLIFLGTLVAVYSFILYNFFMTSEKIKHVQIFNVLKLIIVNGVVLYLLYNKNDDGVFLRLKYAYLVELLIVSIFYFGYLKEMNFSFELTMVKRIIKLSFPTFLGSIVGIFSNFSDKFILEKHVGMKDMAIYGFANAIAGILFMLFSSFNNIWLPIFYKEKDVVINFKKTTEISFIVSIVSIILGIFLMISLYVAILLGVIEKEYIRVFQILPFVILSNIFNMLSHIYGVYFVYYEKVLIQVIINTGLTIVIVILNSILISKFKMMGATISVMLASFLSFIIYVICAILMKKRVLKKI